MGNIFTYSTVKLPVTHKIKFGVSRGKCSQFPHRMPLQSAWMHLNAEWTEERSEVEWLKTQKQRVIQKPSTLNAILLV